MTITVDVGNATAKNAIKIFYDLVLNDIRTAEIYTDGSDTTLRSEYDTESVVKIYRNGVLEFEGEVIETDSTQGGGVIMYCIGQENELTETPAPVDAGTHSKIWTSTTDNTIINTIITEASGWSTDVTGSTGTTLDSFKVTDSMSVWNALIKWIKTTDKDFYIVDSTKTVYLVDAKNRTDKASFNEGSNCGNVSYRKRKPEAAKVIVYGKGDGDQQIIGTSGSGTPIKSIVDRSVFTTAEANTRAAAELSKIVSSIYNYTFNCYNTNEDVETGDTVVLNAPSAGLFNTSADIVRIRRQLTNDTESLSLEVSDTTSRKASDKNTKIIFQLSKNYDISQSSMQGSGNLSQWGGQINGNLTYGLRVPFYVGSRFQDEAGTLRIASITVDYDVDKYSQQYGTASFDGTDPQVQNSSANTQPGVSGSSSNTAPGVSGSSSNTAPGVSGTSASTTITSQVGTDSWSEAVSSAGWDEVASVSINGTYGMLYAYCNIQEDGWSGTDTLSLRIDIGGTSYVIDPQIPFSTAVDGYIRTFPIPLLGSFNTTCKLYLYSTGARDYQGTFTVFTEPAGHTHADGSLSTDSHLHADGSYSADSHLHADGSYSADSHLHTDGTYDINASDIDNISISDGIGEAGSLNANSVSIYLDKWNTGTSSWDNIHSVVNTGATLETDVDLSDSGTYPNSTGFWSIRILTNSASPDLIKAIVNVKHELDN